MKKFIKVFIFLLGVGVIPFFKVNNIDFLYAGGSMEKLTNAEWEDHIISGETKSSSAVKKLKIKNFYADLKLTEVDGIQSIQYKVKGIPDKFIKIKETNDSFELIEESMFGKKNHENIKVIATMEIKVPKDMLIDFVDVKSSIGSTEIENVNCGVIEINSSVGQINLDGIKCSKIEMDTSVSSSFIKNIDCETAGIETSVGNLNIENFTAKNEVEITSSVGNIEIENAYLKNPSLSTSTGNLFFKGKMDGDVYLKSSVGNITCSLSDSNLIKRMTLKNSNGKLRVADFTSEYLLLNSGNGNVYLKNMQAKKSDITGSNGKFTFEECTLENAALDLGIGGASFLGVLKGECFIKSGIGKCLFKIKAPKENYRFKFKKVSKPKIKINGINMLEYGNEEAENVLHLDEGMGAVTIDFVTN